MAQPSITSFFVSKKPQLNRENDLIEDKSSNALIPKVATSNETLNNAPSSIKIAQTAPTRKLYLKPGSHARNTKLVSVDTERLLQPGALYHLNNKELRKYLRKRNITPKDAASVKDTRRAMREQIAQSIKAETGVNPLVEEKKRSEKERKQSMLAGEIHDTTSITCIKVPRGHYLSWSWKEWFMEEIFTVPYPKDNSNKADDVAHFEGRDIDNDNEDEDEVILRKKFFVQKQEVQLGLCRACLVAATAMYMANKKVIESLNEDEMNEEYDEDYLYNSVSHFDEDYKKGEYGGCQYSNGTYSSGFGYEYDMFVREW